MREPKTWRRWEPADDAILQTILEDGWTRLQAALVLERSIDSIHCRINRLGLARRRRKVA